MMPYHFLIYVPFVNRDDLLREVVESLDVFRWWTVIIDQSDAGLDSAQSPVLSVWRWRHERKFTVVQNSMLAQALDLHLDFYIFMHSDAVAEPSGIARLVNRAIELERENANWGIIFTHYDAICAINPDIINDVGWWDENFYWYGADVDYYNRIAWAGRERHYLGGVCAKHYTSQTLAALPEHERERVNAEHAKAREYYKQKWGCYWDEGEGRLWARPFNVQD
jgi:hypothetical protein